MEQEDRVSRLRKRGISVLAVLNPKPYVQMTLNEEFVKLSLTEARDLSQELQRLSGEAGSRFSEAKRRVRYDIESGEAGGWNVWIMIDKTVTGEYGLPAGKPPRLG